MTLNAQLIALLAIIASVAVWIAVLARLRRGEEVLPLEPRRPAPWGFVDLLLVVMGWFLLEMLGVVLLREVWRVDFPEDIRALGDHVLPLQLVYIASRLATLAFAIVLVCLHTKATPTDLGLRFERWRRDLLVGFLGFIALTPPIYALQWTLVHFFPTQHPMIDILRERPESGTVIAISVSVAIVAPITEEFFLRVLLQGWLERIAAAAVPGAFHSPASGNPNEPPVAQTSPAPNGEAQTDNLNVPPLATRVSLAGDAGDVRVARAIPIITSSLVFAVLHVGHGPAPIPLFFLALGLGYLYQRTHRLWAPVLVHFLLNTASLAMLWFGVD